MSMTIITIVTFLLSVSLCSCDHQFHQPDYPFDIDAEGGAIEGYITSEAEEGTKVLVKPVAGQKFKENGTEVQYLRVVIRSGKKTEKEELVVENTEMFRVDNDGFIVLNSSDHLNESQVFEFYVVMFEGNNVVSDPVPFIVLTVRAKSENHSEADHSHDEYNHNAAIFAGVLICLIVALALLIPLVVRAKRRHKQGKPLFKPGSHPSALSAAIAAEKGSQTNLALHIVHDENTLKHRAMTEGDFYDNYGYRLEQEVEREKNELSHDLLAIAKHANELDGADNVIQLSRKQQNSDDSDSGVSSDVKNDRSRGILKNNHSEKPYTIEMTRKSEVKPKMSQNVEESAHL